MRIEKSCERELGYRHPKLPLFLGYFNLTGQYTMSEWTPGRSLHPFKIGEQPDRDPLRVSDESRIWTGLRVVIGLTPDKDEKRQRFKELAGWKCSPLAL